MPWQETSPMDQRLRFLSDQQRGLYDMRELRARYRWLARDEAEGTVGLACQSTAEISHLADI